MNNEQYIMAIDAGTTSVRAIIFNHDGQIVQKSQREFHQYFPHSGWVEHDAEEIWHKVQSVMSEALIESQIPPYKIRGIGITNQRETTVVWDRNTGKPIYHAIVWQSKQTSEIADQIKHSGWNAKIHQKTGLIVDSYFSATKIKWLLNHVPDAQSRAESGDLMFGTIDTWLLWKLTNGHVHATDYSNASRTMLYNIHDLKWDQDILDYLNIPIAMLPKVKPSSYHYGYTEGYSFQGVQVPITGIAGDQQAALFGQQAWEPGMVKNTYGTGAFIVMNTGQAPTISDQGLLTTIGYGLDNKVYYALEGSIFVAGSAIQWLRDGMRVIDHSSDSERLALHSENDEGLYVVPAFTGLGAPYWNQNTRGAVFGLTRGTSREDFVRATLDSLAYQTKDVINTMAADTGLKLKNLSVDGGAANNNYLMQFQSDILDLPIERSSISETTALGVTYLAGLSVGYWKDQADLKRLSPVKDEFEPHMSVAKRQKFYQGWQSAVKAAQMFRY